MADRSAAYREALAGLREELAELEARMAKVRTSIDVIADLIGDGPAAAALVQRASELIAEAPVAGHNESPPQPTIAEAAQTVLREAGRHMRALPITERILELGLIRPEGTVADFRASVGSVLAKNARRQRIFTKPAKGLFGLVEWGMEGKGPNESEDDLLLMMLNEDDGEEDEAAEIAEEQKEAAGG